MEQKSMSAAHTPTPWRVDDKTEIYSEAKLAHIGRANPHDAAFIVRACNAHDELVAALQWIAAAATVGGISAGERKGLKRAADVAKAALAKAQA